MRFILFGLAGIALMAPASAEAQEEKPSAACAQTDTALPAEFIGWTHRATMPAAIKMAVLKGSTLAIGKGVDATLPVTSKVAYLTRPEKPGGSVSHGGLFQFTIDKEGAYAVALGSGASVDVLKGNAAQTSIARGHGPDCSSIRKVVDYRLTPGTYVLQVSANADAKLPLMIARRP